LLKTFKSVKKIKELPLADLAEAIGGKRANIVFNYFHPATTTGEP
jgi:excinuclease ABC subunit C